MRADDEDFVWVVRDGKAEKHAVKIGAAKDGHGARPRGARRRRDGRSSTRPRRLRAGTTVELQAAQ